SCIQLLYRFISVHLMFYRVVTLLFKTSAGDRDLLSFPTRRSSDLILRSIASNEIERPSSTFSVVVVVVVACVVVVVVVGFAVVVVVVVGATVVVVVVGAAVDVVVVVGGVSPPCTPGTSSG